MKVRIGQLVKIANKKSKSFTNENDIYMAVWVKTSQGKECFLFTEVELKKIKERSKKNKEDYPKRSFLSKLID